MKTILCALITLLWVHASWAFTIATGPNDGTYFQIAQDIKNLAQKEGIELQVVPTKGSFENLQFLGTNKAELAIVQLDALRFVSDIARQQQGLDVFDSIKVVLNLYPEEIHILSKNKDIQSFYNLEGKRVSVGVPGGGTALTAAVLLSVYDIKAMISNDTFEDAVKKIDQGALDAVVYVGGAPVPFIGKLDGGFHFVRLPANPTLEQIYFRTRLGSKQYAWAAGDTETFSVPSAIMGVDNRTEEFAGQMQRLVLAILNGRESLEANGHPKWRNAIIQTYFPYRGYEPTNQLIQIFNILDRQGYKILKK